MIRELFTLLPWSIKSEFHFFAHNFECRWGICIFLGWIVTSHQMRVPATTAIGLHSVIFSVILLILTKRSQIKEWRMSRPRIALLRNHKARDGLQARQCLHVWLSIHRRMTQVCRLFIQTSRLTRGYLDAIVCWVVELRAACWAGWIGAGSSWAPSLDQSRGVSPESRAESPKLMRVTLPFVADLVPINKSN